MNPQVLRRYILLMFVAILVAGALTMGYDSFTDRPPGDYETERGDTHLGIGEYDKALEYFNQALKEAPDHRGAIMGRALVFVQMERYREAEAELDYLVAYLQRSLQPDDKTGVAALAAAFANRGIVKDRRGEYEAALKDYIKALNVDEGAVSGPDLVHKILYEANPSTVRDRAIYIYEQLQLPPGERLLRVPEIDDLQRMYKP
jgi:tetratricopeptide (TPR) repeat protein